MSYLDELKKIDMITFSKCSELCQDENAVNNLEEKIKELEVKYGDRSCNCHPEYEWKIAVDILADCTYNVHQVNDKIDRPCEFDKTIMRKEIIPFLSNQV